MDTRHLSEGAQRRLKRVQELRNCNELAALEYCCSMGWFAAEKRAAEMKQPRIKKENLNGTR